MLACLESSLDLFKVLLRNCWDMRQLQMFQFMKEFWQFSLFFEIELVVARSCGATDNASDYGSEDSRFESWQDR